MTTLAPAPTPTPTPVLERLRHATAGRHAEVESTLRLDSGAPLSRYVMALQVFDAFLRAWEPRLLQALPPRLHGFAEARQRGHFATQDLQRLAATRLPGHAAVLPTLPGRGAALGSLYVLEGSTLGGRVIARAMHNDFGVGAENGASFFGARGPHALGQWHEFCALLERELGGDEPALAQACAAANETFAALSTMFRRQSDS